MASATEEPKRVLCRYYKTPGGCWFGKECLYYHEGEEQVQRTADPKLCRYFSTVVGCRFGENCRFVHRLPTTNSVERGDDSRQGEANEEEGCPTPTEDGQTSDECENFEDAVDESPSEGQSTGASSSEVTQSEASTDGSSDEVAATDKEIQKRKKKERMAEWKPKDSYICGECKQVFCGKDSYDVLLKHHMDMLCKMDKSHMTFLGTSHWFNQFVVCGACGKDFARARDLLRHLVDKSKVVKQKRDQELHHSLLEKVARAFADRDVGLTTESESREELLIYLTSHIDHENGSDSDSSDIGLGMGLYMLSEMSRWHRMSSEDYEDELEQRMMNCGFTDAEAEELLCQGIKPWDDCAHGALAALHGAYDIFN